MELVIGDTSVAVTVNLGEDFLRLTWCRDILQELSYSVEAELILVYTRAILFILFRYQGHKLLSALPELCLVLLLRGDEAQKDLLHDARLPHSSHPLCNQMLLSIPLLDQADVLGTAGSPLLVKHVMSQEGVSAEASYGIF